MSKLIPHVVVSDANAAADLYQRAFGAETLQKVPGPDGKQLMHCHLKVNGADLYIMDPMQGPATAPAGFILHLAKQPWGAIYGQLKDRFGVTWSISAAP
jgi:uncharacterized glyoxalase superfamily protein PhnB